MTEQQATSGGAIGKLTGRAKELAGSVLGRDDLHREGKLQQVQSEAEKDAARLAAEAKQKDGEAELEQEKAGTAAERRQVELEAGKIEAEERAERKLAEERRETELEAADLKQKAQRAEEAASLIEHKGKS
jgi:uncharacterized protein YjbJ (UPF0337 family)